MDYQSKRMAEKAISRLEQCENLDAEYAKRISSLVDALSGSKKPKAKKAVKDGE